MPATNKPSPLTPKQVVRKFLKALPQAKPDELTRLTTPDVVAYQGSHRAQGHAAVTAYAAHHRQALPGWRYEIDQMVAEGSSVAVRGVTTSSTGARVSWVAFYKVARGRVAEVRMTVDESSVKGLDTKLAV